jgi:hypothetical protein
VLFRHLQREDWVIDQAIDDDLQEVHEVCVGFFLAIVEIVPRVRKEDGNGLARLAV